MNNSESITDWNESNKKYDKKVIIRHTVRLCSIINKRKNLNFTIIIQIEKSEKSRLASLRGFEPRLPP